MKMESSYDSGAVEARWLGRREPGSVLPAGAERSDPAAEARRVEVDVFDRLAQMGGGPDEPPPGAGPSAPPGTTGVDAFRLAVAFGSGDAGRAGRLLNKLWHVSRWALARLEAPGTAAGSEDGALADRWISGRLDRTVARTGEALSAGDLAAGVREVDEFVRNALSAKYLPLAGDRADGALAETLAAVLGRLLALLHPIAPVVTEEIRNHLSRVAGEPPVRLEDGPWPVAEGGPSAEDEARLNDLIGRRKEASGGDPEDDLLRLHREFESLADRIRAVERRLSNRDFVARAPARIVARERGRRDELAAEVTRMRERIDSLEEVRE